MDELDRRRKEIELAKLEIELAAMRSPMRRLEAWSPVIAVAAAAIGLAVASPFERYQMVESRIQHRFATYMALSEQLSLYTFAASNVLDSIERGRTSMEQLDTIQAKYDNARATLVAKEYALRASLELLWGPAQAEDFDRLMAKVERVDQQMRWLEELRVDLHETETDRCCSWVNDDEGNRTAKARCYSDDRCAAVIRLEGLQADPTQLAELKTRLTAELRGADGAVTTSAELCAAEAPLEACTRGFLLSVSQHLPDDLD